MLPYATLTRQTCLRPKTRALISLGWLGLNSIRQPSWNKIRIGQLTPLHPVLIFFLHGRLHNSHEVTKVTVDQPDRLVVPEVVSVVKQGVKTV